ncbi:MAG: putative signal peptide peptidase SppA [Syntrophorhabdaceae bacterium PtaU1.Bin034]|jgi:protease-4|nr:MAG: putative signal peptide peptidase SppA [Syntrophorhabdaceae bacterium PtaU1.Bin034]
MPWSRKKKAFVVILSLVVIIFFVSFIAGLSSQPSGDRIGVVEIEGVISGSKETMDDIIRFKEDPTIKGVILRINSPGGGVGPTQEIYREVIKLKEKKKVYVSMGTSCASGGYYIASAAEKLYANPSTITGSIGVIMQLMIIEDVLKKIGLKNNTIKAGEFKDAGSPFRGMTPEERAYMEGITESIHEQFMKDIAAGRKMKLETVRKLAQGKIYTGNQAKELGLIDAIGNFYDTVDALKDELKITGKPSLIYTEKPFSFSKWLFGSISQELANQLFSSPAKFMMSP